MLKKAIVTTVDACTRYAWQVIALAILLGVVGGLYAASHFAIDADVNKLISQGSALAAARGGVRQVLPGRRKRPSWR